MADLTLRRDLTKLWVNVDLKEELDRFYIALYRFQTEGRIAYRRIIGMHGGGGGTSDPEFLDIMKKKMELDINDHYPETGFPDDAKWPEPVPNGPFPHHIPKKHQGFAYTFCWHVEPEFLVWHRPLMIEIEREMQRWDPKYKDKEPCHSGSDALGMPYFAWESWDGITLPAPISDKVYTVRTDSFAEAGFLKGTQIPNPLFRWYAPVSIENQLAEKFPESLNDVCCTTRSLSFQDPSIIETFPWPVQPYVSKGKKVPSMKNVVNGALKNHQYHSFSTVKYGGNFSIENPHNKFHNHCGGNYGTLLNGTNLPKPFDTVTGTMAQNQSIFDPLFFVHHSNIERQLMSWKKLWFKDGEPIHEDSMPDEKLMNTVLYPWTKPDMVPEDKLSWNTQPGKENDGTFGDWFNATVGYEYEDYLVPTRPFRMKDVKHKRRVKVTASFPASMGGEFTLERGGAEEASIAVLSAFGSGCPRCSSKKEFQLPFILEQSEEQSEADPSKEFVLKRNGVVVEAAFTAVEEKGVWDFLDEEEE